MANPSQDNRTSQILNLLALVVGIALVIGKSIWLYGHKDDFSGLRMIAEIALILAVAYLTYIIAMRLSKDKEIK